MVAVGIIPARYASSRLPGKALAEIAGRTMIEHVYRQARKAKSLTRVIIATDDPRIEAAVRAFGGEVALTRADHPSGTDRIAEVAAGLDADVVVNIQGDEPTLDPAEIDLVATPFETQPELVMSTVAVPIRDPRDVTAPSAVKVVRDQAGFALYFSRLPLPYYRSGSGGPHLKHKGLYAYRREFLLKYSTMAPTPLEQAEALEQLRALEHGYRILVLLSAADSIGVDTEEDLERVRAMFARGEIGGDA